MQHGEGQEKEKNCLINSIIGKSEYENDCFEKQKYLKFYSSISTHSIN